MLGAQRASSKRNATERAEMAALDAPVPSPCPDIATTHAVESVAAVPRPPVRLFMPCRACAEKEKPGCPACRQSGMVWRQLSKAELEQSCVDGAMHPSDMAAMVAWRGREP